jgi:hypothetical protein
VKLDSKNAFYGCRLKNNSVVVKVNEKSYYAYQGTLEEFETKQSASKSRKETMKDFFKKENIKMLKYDNAEFDETQSRPTIKTKEKKLFDKHMQNTIKLHYERMLRTNTRTETIHYDNYQVTILAMKDAVVLIAYDGAFYFYDVMSGSHTYIESISEKKLNSKNIPWDMVA